MNKKHFSERINLLNFRISMFFHKCPRRVPRIRLYSATVCCVCLSLRFENYLLSFFFFFENYRNNGISLETKPIAVFYSL